MIVAIGSNGEIGRKGDLIWHLPEDLKRFKALTIGHPVIMGRKTWESLPNRPLPGRRNIVLTHNVNLEITGAEVVNSVEEALDITKGESPFIIGGAEIYNSFLPFVSTIYLTVVNESCQDADAFLSIPFNSFRQIEESALQISSSPDSPSFLYQTYKRI